MREQVLEAETGGGPQQYRFSPRRDLARVRGRHRRKRNRRRAGLVGLMVLGGVAALWVSIAAHGRGYVTLKSGKSTVKVPNTPHLSPTRARIVAIAESQVGYTTNPPTTYCNKFSAYWDSGSGACGSGELAEEWCADFAAWVWQKAGVPLVYQYVNGDLNSSAASFYEWGRAEGTWHPLGSGYVPQPGDVAVYGLDPSSLVASHVAIVIAYKPGEKGPTAVNGDGDFTAFSAVEVRTDEYYADVHPDTAPLSGYVSPN
ncbi:MAG TPA: CHAP domain-containing protein [Acidimicrobiales bacterium]|nr:CHAP domain-containing protein [Acidimicrobiales bacterium]